MDVAPRYTSARFTWARQLIAFLVLLAVWEAAARAGMLNLTDAGNLNVPASATLAVGGNTTLNAAGTLSIADGAVVTLQSGAKVIVAQNGTSAATSSVSALNIAGSSNNWQASLDLV